MFNHALQGWASEYAARTNPTPDSGLTYLIHARVAQTTRSFAKSRMIAPVSYDKKLSYR